jgi:hypothetical protein
VQALSSQELLKVWEWGQGRHVLDRPLGLLATAHPDSAWRELASLSIGQRNTQLLTVREHTLGGTLRGFAACPMCDERLEFTLKTQALRNSGPDCSAVLEHTLEVGEFSLRFHLPNSLDLAAVAQCDDPTEAQRVLLERCLLEADQDGNAVDATSLPETVIEAVAAEMEALDAQAELWLELHCPRCAHEWSVLLDIANFFWTEISALARHLLREVHALAKAYGWHEADILAMSPLRRGLYLEMIGE